MYAVAAVLVLATMALTLIRALKGPTVFDRINAVNCFGTLTVALLAIYGFLTDRPEFLDIALAYALITFVGTIAVSRFVEASGYGPNRDREDEL